MGWARYAHSMRIFVLNSGLFYLRCAWAHGWAQLSCCLAVLLPESPLHETPLPESPPAERRACLQLAVVGGCPALIPSAGWPLASHPCSAALPCLASLSQHLPHLQAHPRGHRAD